MCLAPKEVGRSTSAISNLKTKFGECSVKKK